VQKFGLGLVAKFCFGVYSGEAKGSVLALRVTFVCFWSFHLLLRDRDIFFVVPRSSWIYFVSKKFHDCVIFYFVV
jgi:hypothetical protein